MSNNPVSVDVKNILVANSIGVFGVNAVGWSIFIGRQPADPNNIISIYDSAGSQPPNPKWLLDYPNFQVRVRATNYLDAESKSLEIKNALLGLPSQDINDIRYVGIYIVTDPFFMEADERNRSIFVSLWRTIREPSSGGNRSSL